jgi:NAD(P)-dependent dehydrogenase (short-subunit alcohol dehydrogenase family)
MTPNRKTVIVTGASQGIGAAIANLFLERGYNVVGNPVTSAKRMRSSAREKFSAATNANARFGCG